MSRMSFRLLKIYLLLSLFLLIISLNSSFVFSQSTENHRENPREKITYQVIVSSNGDVVVVIKFIEKGLYEIPLPLDVSYPEVKGGLYIKKQYGIDLYVEKTPVYVAYKTSLFTVKNMTWIFEMDNVTADSLIINLPKNTEIINTSPLAKIAQEALLKVFFEDLNNQKITLEYRMLPEQKRNTFYSVIFYAALILIVFLAAFVVILYSKTKPKQGDFKATQGQYNIIRTLSNNEKIILKHLLANDGQMKRNELEKISGLSKSSLANSLNNLEQKEIITIDKTYSVHFIKISEWFKTL